MSARSLFKRFFKTSAFRTFVCWLIATYIRLVYYTSRRRIEIDEAAKPYARGELPAVFAFWHGRLLMMAMLLPPGRTMHALISNHRDGEMISRTMKHFGIESVRGSSSRGGATAAMNAVKLLQNGNNVCVTPDGPRGPAMQLQPGALAIAEIARVPVIPVTYSATRCRHMRSWDSFMVVLPFGRLHYKVGAPVMGETKEELEVRMVRLTQELDKQL